MAPEKTTFCCARASACIVDKCERLVRASRPLSATLYDVKKKRRRKLLDPVELGRRRWKGLSKEQRSELARAAVNARWAKARKAKTGKPAPNGVK